jgi:hypothetical protein
MMDLDNENNSFVKKKNELFEILLYCSIEMNDETYYFLNNMTQ